MRALEPLPPSPLDLTAAAIAVLALVEGLTAVLACLLLA